MSMSRSLLFSRVLPGALPALLLFSCGETPLQEGAPQSAITDDSADDSPARLPEPMSVEPTMPAEPTIESAVDCTVAPTTRKDLVCWRWRCDRAARSEGTWSGSLAACNAGDISAAGRSNALKLPFLRPPLRLGFNVRLHVGPKLSRRDAPRARVVGLRLPDQLNRVGETFHAPLLAGDAEHMGQNCQAAQHCRGLVVLQPVVAQLCQVGAADRRQGALR